MSSIDDIDDEVVVVAPVQTMSLWARKKQEKQDKLLQERKQEETLGQNHSHNNDTTDGLSANRSKTSTLFSRLQAKLNTQQHFLPTSHDEKLPPLPPNLTNLTKPFYTIQPAMSCTELDLELIRLVAFYRACHGDAFDRILRQKLKKRQLDIDTKAQLGIKTWYSITSKRLDFLHAKHPLYPLFIQYTHIYKHIINTLQKNTSQNLTNSLPTGAQTNVEEIETEHHTNTNSSSNNDQHESNPPDNTLDPLKITQPHSAHQTYEVKIIANIPPPPTTIISNVLTTPQLILSTLIIHAQYNYRQVLQEFHDRMVEHLEFEASATIDWKQFAVLDTIDFGSTQEEELLLPAPCTSSSDLRILFETQEKLQKLHLQGEKDNIEKALGEQNIDDIDDSIDSYIATSRSGLSGYSGSSSSSSSSMVIDHIDTNNQFSTLKRRQPHPLGDRQDHDDEDLTIVSLSEAEKLLSNVNTSAESNPTLAKCEVCQQMIPIDELAQHMKMELANPDWRIKQQNNLNSDGIRLSGYNLNNVTTQSATQVNAALALTPSTQPPPPPPHIPAKTTTSSLPVFPPPQIYDNQYMVQQHQEFVQQSKHHSVPLPPSLDGMGGFHTPIPPASFQHSDNKRPYNTINLSTNPALNPVVSLQHTSGISSNTSHINIEIIDITNNHSQTVRIESKTLVSLEDEKALIAGSMTPLNWEYACLYEEKILVHEIKINIPLIEDHQQFNFLGQTLIIKIPTLRLSVGDFRKLIQNEILNKLEKRIKLNTVATTQKKAAFLNNDTASLAAYQICNGDTIQVSLQKYTGKR